MNYPSSTVVTEQPSNPAIGLLQPLLVLHLVLLVVWYTNPVLWPVGIAAGSSIAVGLHMTYDVLRSYDL